MNTSIVTLTIRRDPTSGEASFFLLRRDPAKVVTGGGEYCLIPAGEFQPASVSPDSVLSDLDIWRNIVREYSEELLGNRNMTEEVDDRSTIRAGLSSGQCRGLVTEANCGFTYSASHYTR